MLWVFLVQITGEFVFHLGHRNGIDATDCNNHNYRSGVNAFIFGVW